MKKRNFSASTPDFSRMRSMAGPLDSTHEGQPRGSTTENVTKHHFKFNKNRSCLDLSSEGAQHKYGYMDNPRAIKVKRRIIRRSKHGSSSNLLGSDDDASSINSDHSTSPGYRKKMKRIRRSCPVHGKNHMIKKYGDKAYDMPEFQKFKSPSPSRDNSCDAAQAKFLPSVQEEDGTCTCDTASPRRSSRSSRTRPDPEGSSASFINLNLLDDFHKLIYENEPLFSDMEDDEEIDLQIKQESERYHKRSSQAFKNIFSSALCYNSSTMMKFAIIQNEVRNLMEGHLKVVRKTVRTYNFTS